MITWLTTSFLGRMILTTLVSMIPVVELRGGIPIGYCGIWGPDSGLGYWAIPAAVIGNLLPMPFILLFLQKVFGWMRSWGGIFKKIVEWLEAKAAKKSAQVQKYTKLGLMIFVAIPLPGTGAWTGALIASCLGMKFKDSMFSVVLGVLIAAAIVTVVTMCGSTLFVSLTH